MRYGHHFLFSKNHHKASEVTRNCRKWPDIANNGRKLPKAARIITDELLLKLPLYKHFKGYITEGISENYRLMGIAKN